tara:strand:+ start:999 stop:2072 length:1074 start_codon:yes stop_codon:yes gene_type:complete
MDDYSMSSLGESKNEWCASLVNTLTPAIIDGLKSIFKEALELCEENDENDKYLMTFQTFLSRIPKWNDSIIGEERTRIEKFTQCGYLEELITCVHVVKLKALTCVRVGQQQKKIDIDIPSADTFIHKVYINVARKLYTNVYLFEADLPPLELQKNNRQLELFAQESILNTIRDTMPVETILRAYMDETEEEEVNIKEEIIEEPVVEEPEPESEPETSAEPKPSESAASPPEVAVPNTMSSKQQVTSAPLAALPVAVNIETEIETPTSPENISFSHTDNAQDALGNETLISAPKTIERLEQIALESAQKRREEEEEDDEDDEDRLTIGNVVDANSLDIDDLNKPSDPLLDLGDIEILS